MMTPEFADSFAKASAAYVHIPFCSSVCPYCDFAVVAGKDQLAESYIDCLVEEIARSDPWRPLEAVYFGGGTPSHVDPVLLARVLDALANRHGIAADAEISLEANPEDFDGDRAGLIESVGFNRVSFGAQSFDPGVLLSLGRRHRSEQIERAFRGARRAGLENLSLDLIYGTPGESDDSWIETLQRAVSLEPDHLSCYALTVEGGTPLGRAVRDGAPAPDPDVQADRFETADSMIPLGRYEVSNWARPGYECRYNLTVWAQGEYEAYGNGAHGFRDGTRFRNHRRLEAYIDAIESNRSPRAGEELVEGWDAELDRLFVGLRRSVGVVPGAGGHVLFESGDGARLVAAGVISVESDRLIVSRPLLTDAVQRSVLGLQAPIVSHTANA